MVTAVLDLSRCSDADAGSRSEFLAARLRLEVSVMPSAPLLMNSGNGSSGIVSDSRELDGGLPMGGF